MFDRILYNPDNGLHSHLPPVPTVSQNYSLTPQAHGRQLPDRFHPL